MENHRLEEEQISNDFGTLNCVYPAVRELCERVIM